MATLLKSTWSKIGLILIIFGWGPLLAVILLAGIGLWPDPNPNPIGLGLLFAATFWPAIICLVVGIIRSHNQAVAGSNTDSSAIHPEPAPKITPLPTQPELTPDQVHYLNRSSLGASLGIFYFAALGIIPTYFSHLPGYFNYLNYIQNGRRHAWEAKSWESFEVFKSKNNQLDHIAKYLLIGSISVLVVFLVIVGFN